MIWIRPERFPSGTVKKLQAHSARPFKVLKQMGLNAYVIDLPHDYVLASPLILRIQLLIKAP